MRATYVYILALSECSVLLASWSLELFSTENAPVPEEALYQPGGCHRTSGSMAGDDAAKKQGEQSLEDGGNWIQIWLLSFMYPLLRLGATKVLEQSDVGAPSAQDRAKTAHVAIIKQWKRVVSIYDIRILSFPPCSCYGNYASSAQ